MRIVECEQYSPEWWEARRGIPTASGASKIITPAKGDPSKSADSYIYELLAEIHDPFYPDVDGVMTAAMKNGTLMEPECRAMYEFELGLDVREVGLCLTDDGRAGCSPDGLVGEDGGIEIKSPEPKTQVGWLMDGGLPLQHKCQVHWSLAVTGRKWWDFWSFARGLPPLQVRVETDEFTAKVAKVMSSFCDKLATERDKLQAAIDEARDKQGLYSEHVKVEETLIF